ncbi:hypothetical protein JTM35_33480, partial [Pseudomonas aeruginosa]|nr:hypothetical protein [Pseudomonas aeruginosa]
GDRKAPLRWDSELTLVFGSIAPQTPGFERWHEPTRIIKHWHYTPVWAVATLREAKRQVARVVRSIPDLEAKS